MLSKTCSDQDLKEMFQEFGPVEEVTVLRNHDATSKGENGLQIVLTFSHLCLTGCAFVKLPSRNMAQAAINKMHGSRIMPVCMLLGIPVIVTYNAACTGGQCTIGSEIC